MNYVINRFGTWLLIALYSMALAVSAQVTTVYSHPDSISGFHEQHVTTGTSQQIERHVFPGKTIIEHTESSGIHYFTADFPLFFLQSGVQQFVYPEAKIQQYLKTAVQRVIYSRKSDLIFPFHYFW